MVIDRETPCFSPQGIRAMRHCWRDLLFLHWEIDPDEIQPRLPSGLTLDTYDGKAYVGLVAFSMPYLRLARPISLPLEYGVHEVNVRTYVHREGRDPGVWFFSLDTPSVPAVIAARTSYKLPYHWSQIEINRGEKGSLRFQSRRIAPKPTPAGCDIEYTRDGDAKPAELGTLEHFLAERYILYSKYRGALHQAYVNHVPYPLQTPCLIRLQENLTAAAGITRPAAPPIAHYARQVEVDIYGLRRLFVSQAGRDAA
ncbi:MAG TPA: DUF2071 domain-containing protein [Capsulimonadaceae bacterium]|nr:DUF2071 domain-containing protein [Capsulimonadaceae bacterium]